MLFRLAGVEAQSLETSSVVIDFVLDILEYKRHSRLYAGLHRVKAERGLASQKKVKPRMDIEESTSSDKSRAMPCGIKLYPRIDIKVSTSPRTKPRTSFNRESLHGTKLQPRIDIKEQIQSKIRLTDMALTTTVVAKMDQ